MQKTLLLNGNEAAANGAMLARAGVITCSDSLQQASLAESLEARAAPEERVRFIRSESGRSALACAVGAAHAGSRTFTALCSDSLASSQDLLFWASGARLPLVMASATTSMGAGAGVWGDLSNAAAQRDSGWVSLCCQSAQEVLDSVLIAYRMGSAIRLPVMVCYDATRLARTSEAVKVPDAAPALSFAGDLRPGPEAWLKEPRAVSPYTCPEYHTEFRHKLYDALGSAAEAFADAAKEFARHFDRRYSAVERIDARGAQTVLVAAGAAAGTAKAAIDMLRKAGEQVGFLTMRMLSPAPEALIREALLCSPESKGVKRVVVLDDSTANGACGTWASIIRAALAGARDAPEVVGIIAGAGGRDFMPEDICAAFARAKELRLEDGQVWVGLRR